jgi:hypothetical protein
MSTGPKAFTQKTGKPVDYDPSKDTHSYASIGNLNPNEPLKKVCPLVIGGNNFCRAPIVPGPGCFTSQL